MARSTSKGSDLPFSAAAFLDGSFRKTGSAGRASSRASTLNTEANGLTPRGRSMQMLPTLTCDSQATVARSGNDEVEHAFFPAFFRRNPIDPKQHFPVVIMGIGQEAPLNHNVRYEEYESIVRHLLLKHPVDRTESDILTMARFFTEKPGFEVLTFAQLEQTLSQASLLHFGRGAVIPPPPEDDELIHIVRGKLAKFEWQKPDVDHNSEDIPIRDSLCNWLATVRDGSEEPVVVMREGSWIAPRTLESKVTLEQRLGSYISKFEEKGLFYNSAKGTWQCWIAQEDVYTLLYQWNSREKDAPRSVEATSAAGVVAAMRKRQNIDRMKSAMPLGRQILHNPTARRIMANFPTSRLGKGTAILTPPFGEESCALRVVSGTVRAYARIIEGPFCQEIELETLKAGAWVGPIACIDQQNLPKELRLVVVSGVVEIQRVPADFFREQLSEHLGSVFWEASREREEEWRDRIDSTRRLVQAGLAALAEPAEEIRIEVPREAKVRCAPDMRKLPQPRSPPKAKKPSGKFHPRHKGRIVSQMLDDAKRREVEELELEKRAAEEAEAAKVEVQGLNAEFCKINEGSELDEPDPLRRWLKQDMTELAQRKRFNPKVFHPLSLEEEGSKTYAAFNLDELPLGSLIDWLSKGRRAYHDDDSSASTSVILKSSDEPLELRSKPNSKANSKPHSRQQSGEPQAIVEELREHFLQQEKVEPPIGQSAYMLPAKSEEFAAAVERRIFRGSIQADRLNLQGAEMLRPRRHRYMSQERAQTPDVSVLPPEALRRSGRHRPTVEPNISRQTTPFHVTEDAPSVLSLGAPDDDMSMGPVDSSPHERRPASAGLRARRVARGYRQPLPTTEYPLGPPALPPPPPRPPKLPGCRRGRPGSAMASGASDIAVLRRRGGAHSSTLGAFRGGLKGLAAGEIGMAILRVLPSEYGGGVSVPNTLVEEGSGGRTSLASLQSGAELLTNEASQQKAAG